MFPAELSLEVATIDDGKDLAEIMSLADQFFTPGAEAVGLTEAEEILNGYIESVEARKIVDRASGKAQAFITVHPDSSRKRIYCDTWQRPGANLEGTSLEISLEIAQGIGREFDLWIGTNSKDLGYIQALTNRGFNLLRTYHGLKAEITNHPYPQLESGLEMRLINEDEKKIWWATHQDSFSKHFGFAPRPFEEWKAMIDKAVGIDLNARWVLYLKGQAVGFIECSDIKKDVGAGFVDGIGVIQSQQGNGYGELMLRWAFAYYSSIARSALELNVDTGNESGALRLYEKLGFKANSSWQHFENKAWVKL
ncbi:MAG: GNAT family N-acetyltransferase [Candidatus Nanopelagicaceae bacterium]|nr:GNAT family N-acetyltransferase [Candidatus Nanopelagicaceae bacterium]